MVYQILLLPKSPSQSQRRWSADKNQLKNQLSTILLDAPQCETVPPLHNGTGLGIARSQVPIPPSPRALYRFFAQSEKGTRNKCTLHTPARTLYPPHAHTQTNRLGQEGATVIISSRKQPNVDKALKQLSSEGIKCHGKACHAGKKEAIKELIEFTISQCGRIDVLVANAGVTVPSFGKFLKTEDWVWKRILDVNILG